MSEGVEYRVRWRDAERRQIKRFADSNAAAAFVAALTETTATDIRYQARRVEPWKDVDA